VIVARTDLVAVIAERIARLYAAEYNLMLFDPPVRLPEFTISVLTSAARARDPLQDLARFLVWYFASAGVVYRDPPHPPPLDRLSGGPPRVLNQVGEE